MPKARVFIRLLTSAAVLSATLPLVHVQAGNALPSVEVHMESLNFLRAKQKRIHEKQEFSSPKVSLATESIAVSPVSIAPTEISQEIAPVSETMPAILDAEPVVALMPSAAQVSSEKTLPQTVSRIDLKSATVSRAQIDAIAAATPVGVTMSEANEKSAPKVTDVKPKQQMITKDKAANAIVTEVAPVAGVSQGAVKIRRPESLPLRPHTEESITVVPVTEAPVVPEHTAPIASAAKSSKPKKTPVKSVISEKTLHELPPVTQEAPVTDHIVHESITPQETAPVVPAPESILTPPPMPVPAIEPHSALATPAVPQSTIEVPSAPVTTVTSAAPQPAPIYDPHEDIVPPVLAPIPPSVAVPESAPIVEAPASPVLAVPSAEKPAPKKPSYWERAKSLFTREKPATSSAEEAGALDEPIAAPSHIPPADLLPPPMPTIPAPILDHQANVPSMQVPAPLSSEPIPSQAVEAKPLPAEEPQLIVPEVPAMPVPTETNSTAVPAMTLEPGEPRLLQPEEVPAAEVPTALPNKPVEALPPLPLPVETPVVVQKIEPTPSKAPLPVAPSATELPSASGLPKLLFESSATALSPTLKGRIDEMLVHLKLVSGERLRISGYATATMHEDSEDQARRISLQRVIAVRKYLIDKGFDAMQLNLQALGSSVPGKGDIVEFSVVAGQ